MNEESGQFCFLVSDSVLVITGINSLWLRTMFEELWDLTANVKPYNNVRRQVEFFSFQFTNQSHK